MASMEKRRKRLTLALVMVWLNAGEPGHAEAFTTADIAAAAAIGIDCYDYCLVGICVQLTCDVFGCRVLLNPRIRHHAPDLVVSAYPEPGENPWREMRAVLEGPAKTAAQAQVGTLAEVPVGGGPNDTPRDTAGDPERGRKSRALHFKEATVIGAPVQRVVHSLPMMCPSHVIEFFPYFQSEFDALTWRFGVAELAYPQSWIPGLREIGPWPLGSWGSVYPRHGFVTAVESPKAAAVVAQRAIDIATRFGQPHVYIPARVNESGERHDHWQMISPKLDAKCEPFGSLEDYSPGRVAEDGKYGYLYWPTYECCPLGRGILIGVIPISPVCLL